MLNVSKTLTLIVRVGFFLLLSSVSLSEKFWKRFFENEEIWHDSRNIIAIQED